MRNRIEPWQDPPVSYLPRVRAGPRNVKGTTVHYEGKTLRAHGPYSTTLAEALLASRRHRLAEGVTVS